MTVLVAHNRYRIRGGEDSVFEAECRMLESAGHRVVRYEKTNCGIPDRGGRLGLACRTVWNPRTYREIRAIIRREKPDVVHCHNTFPLISPSIYHAAAREGVPVVQTLHNYRLACLGGYLFRDGKICENCLGRTPWCGLRHRCYRNSLGGSLALFAMLAVHRLLGTWRGKVARYIALTDFSRGKFVEAGLPAGKIAVKPNAVSPPAGGERVGGPGTVESAGSRNPGTPASLRVVYVGRLSPEKGVDVLIRALALLRAPDRGPAPACEIVGDGPERDALESLVRELGLSDRVRFAGALARDEAMAVLSSASLLVFPSLWYETFGLTVLEAASCGVPAVVAGIGGQSSLVRDGATGRHVPPGDPAALAAAIGDLLADPAALRRMGEAARAAFEASDCLPGRNLERLLAVYGACGANVARNDGTRE